jgi:hypothetical protein
MTATKDDGVNLYAVLMRSGWNSGAELEEAAARSTRVSGREMSDDVRWVSSSVLDERHGAVGTGDTRLTRMTAVGVVGRGRVQMRSRKRRTRMMKLARAALLATALGLITGAAPASAAVTYTTQTSTGASIVPGTTDTGNHDDDMLTRITFPFTVTIYGQTFTSAWAGSNGDLQFTTSDTAFTNTCLPASTLGVSIMPYWDDLTLSPSGSGIFTSLTGVAPHRIFNIEWRAR